MVIANEKMTLKLSSENNICSL